MQLGHAYRFSTSPIATNYDTPSPVYLSTSNFTVLNPVTNLPFTAKELQLLRLASLQTVTP